jgi:hypothetical protein
MRTLIATADNVAENGLALETRGDWGRAASQYERAAGLYVEGRDFGAADEMRRRAMTCRRVLGILTA